jgi:hypothetical protein
MKTDRSSAVPRAVLLRWTRNAMLVGFLAGVAAAAAAVMT